MLTEHQENVSFSHSFNFCVSIYAHPQRDSEKSHRREEACRRRPSPGLRAEPSNHAPRTAAVDLCRADLQAPDGLHRPKTDNVAHGFCGISLRPSLHPRHALQLARLLVYTSHSDQLRGRRYPRDPHRRLCLHCGRKLHKMAHTQARYCGVYDFLW